MHSDAPDEPELLECRHPRLPWVGSHSPVQTRVGWFSVGPESGPCPGASSVSLGLVRPAWAGLARTGDSAVRLAGSARTWLDSVPAMLFVVY